MALSPAAAALSKNATRLGANISKRLTRLASKDVKGGDILITRLQTQLEEIRALPVTNYREAQTKEARMRRLDKAAGTRSESFHKAAKRAYRDDLVARASDPNRVLRMTKDELSEVLAVQRSRINGRVRRVKQAINGDNILTRRAEKLLKEETSGASLNRLRSLVSSSTKALAAKSLTPKGAAEIIQYGVDAFGEIYNNLNEEQRSALWKAMRREMELNSISSPDSIELIKTVIETGKLSFGFIESATGEELEAAIGKTLGEAEVNTKRMEINQKNVDDIINNGKVKWLGKDATNNDFWSQANRMEDYTF